MSFVGTTDAARCCALKLHSASHWTCRIRALATVHDSAPETAIVSACRDPVRPISVDPPTPDGRTTGDGRRGLVALSRTVAIAT